MGSKLFALVLGILLCGEMAQATPVDFYSDGLIQTGDEYSNPPYDYVALHNSAILTMTGGQVETSVITYGNSIFNFQGGQALSISAHDSSIVNISGGSISTVYLYDSQNATINLYGGNITMGFYGMLNAQNTINIYGKDFVVWQNQDNAYLSGKWADNSNFEFYFLRSNGLPNIVSLHTIPEPLTISLLAMGCGFIFHRRKPKSTCL